jgi:hypothetical protein
MIATDLGLAAAAAAVLTTAMLLSRAREGMPGPDEGYVWYGTLRTLAGEVPIRDFRSYEPGRYYWCALWMFALGRGLVALRVASHAFYFLGLTGGLLALRLGGVGWPATLTAGVLLAAWGHEPYKLFEPALASIAVLAGVVLITHPGYATIAAAGAVAGAISFFGVNYALYAGAAFLGLTLLEALKSASVTPPLALGALSAGALLGALPLLAMFAFTRRMLAAFLERRVRAVVARRSTNLPRPVPLPWRHAPAAIHMLGPAGRRFMGIYFVLLPAFAWSVAVWAVVVPWPQIEAHAAVVSAGAVCAFNMHHAFSRADLKHLAQSMSPFVLGVVALAGRGLGWIAVAVLLGVGTAVTVLVVHPRVDRLRHPGAYVPRQIAGSSLWIPTSSATLLDTLSPVVRAHLSPDEPMLAVPQLAQLLPILERRSAAYDTYCVYPASEREQQRMLRSIEDERVRLALVADHPVDGRDDLRFSNTHPLVWAHLSTEFERLELSGLPRFFHVLRRDRPSGIPADPPRYRRP